jgi:hypothetical protein
MGTGPSFARYIYTYHISMTDGWVQMVWESTACPYSAGRMDSLPPEMTNTVLVVEGKEY